ncbi:MAG TPA: hypothetical protein VFJ16_17070 [Longimicrobium sp.]|nr:hypothetical protein [Longimicrobium sp.]
MRARHPRTAALALAALLGAGACTDHPDPTAVPSRPRAVVGSPGRLLYFGYAGESFDASSLNGTESYANWAEAITDTFPSSTYVTTQVNAYAGRGMKVLVELGPLLWKDATPTSPRSLRADYVQRWNSWRAANASVLNSTNVLGFLIADEPHWGGIDMTKWQDAAALVKNTYPWSKIVMIEAAAAIGGPTPTAAWNNAPVVQTVDWIGIDRYGRNPATDDTILTARTRMKARYPNRKFVYVADGWFAKDPNVQTYTYMTPGNMGVAMQQWYDFARADTSAILLGTFLWPSFGEGTGSQRLPPSALAKHTEVGRAITGRSRAAAYLPVGVIDTITSAGLVAGWACDPDAAWGETVTVQLTLAGGSTLTTNANLVNPDTAVIAACRSGGYRRFRIQFAGYSGQKVTGVAFDLNAGSSTLEQAKMIWIQPQASAGFGPPGSLVVAGSASGAPAGTVVRFFWRDVTANGPWTQEPYTPTPDANGIWYHAIPNAVYTHRYATFARYDLVQSITCTYFGTNAYTAC